MKVLDLKKLTDGQVGVLFGYDLGTRSRKYFNLDDLDGGEVVSVELPAELESIAPSFVQGFFGLSILKFGSRDRFYSHYKFDGWPSELLTQIDTGLARALMDRSGSVQTKPASL